MDAKPLNLKYALKTVLVFKTSVNCEKDIRHLSNSLNHFGIWNFDLEDCDNILRVEADESIAQSIIHFMHEKGYCCKELE